jgi:hypothetical protein
MKRDALGAALEIVVDFITCAYNYGCMKALFLLGATSFCSKTFCVAKRHSGLRIGVGACQKLFFRGGLMNDVF